MLKITETIMKIMLDPTATLLAKVTVKAFEVIAIVVLIAKATGKL